MPSKQHEKAMELARDWVMSGEPSTGDFGIKSLATRIDVVLREARPTVEQLRKALRPFAGNEDGDWCACVDISEGSKELDELRAALEREVE